MAEKVGERFENPLMPDERLRQMYTAMVQVRLLEENLEARARRAKGKRKVLRIFGEEAARAASALSLEAGDLLSDSTEAPAMDLLLGGSLAEVRGRALGKGKAAATAGAEGHARRLPISEDAEERLQLALGAAAALKVQGAGRVLLVYVQADEVGAKRWKRALHVAGRRELPVIFLVLPSAESTKHLGEMARRARGWGVPGFPVDGADAIGLYRVVQEALLRARMDGGASLIECIRFELDGAKTEEVEDPVERLRELMLAKGAATPEWLKRTRSTVSKRLSGRA